MPKMHQNTIGGRTLAGPAGGAYALPQAPYSQWEGLLLRGRREVEGGERAYLQGKGGREGESLLLRGREEKERRRELGGKGGEGIPEGIPPKTRLIK